MLGGHGLKLNEGFGVEAQCQLGVESILGRQNPQLLETSPLPRGERLGSELSQGWTTPQPERPVESLQRGLGRMTCQRLPACEDQVLEPCNIQLVRVDFKFVPGRMASNTRTRAGRLQRLSQVRQVDVQRVNRSRREFFAPQHVDKSIRSHDSVGVQHQCDE